MIVKHPWPNLETNPQTHVFNLTECMHIKNYSPHFRKAMSFVFSFSVNGANKYSVGPVHVYWEDTIL